MIIENLEVEYKCLVTKSQHDDIVNFYQGKYQLINQLNIYFVDEDGLLTDIKATLRIRIINGDSAIVTLKIPQNNGLMEYEILTNDINDKEVIKLLSKNGIKSKLVEVGRLTTIRKMIELEAAQLCIDENHYNGIVDYEIEYECTKKHDGLSCFKGLLANFNIKYTHNNISKYLRATKL